MGFINGSVFEFKIPLNMGFAYCKVLDFRSIREFDGLLAKVYDYISKEELTDLKVLNSKDWLFGARRMPNIPSIKGKGAWKFKGVLVSKDDSFIPDFKYSSKSSPLVSDEATIKEWNVVQDINKPLDSLLSYESVKHLEDTVLTSQRGIEIRTAMEYCRIKDIDIKSHFDLDDMSNWNIYRTMINVPIYSSIPKGFSGKLKL